MKWLLVVIAVLVVVFAGIWVVGSTLPVAHTATVQRPINAPPEAVWTAITSTGDFPAWRSDVTRVEPLPDREGRAVWREQGSNGVLTFEVVEIQPPTRLITRIADDDLPFGGTWTWTLEPADGATQVSVREDGDVYNPIFRFMSRFVFGHDATMRRFLDDLQRHLERGGSAR